MSSITESSITGDRPAYLAGLANKRSWDLVVIGGGASGLGVALEAASRGYSVLLLERYDFAKGTSSRSTKLVHGGVRYLAQGDLKLVREASIERGYLLRNAPHLVKNQVFLVPVYSLWEKMKYMIGLKLYDWIAGRLSLGSSRFIGREETISRLPGIKTGRLTGSILHHDGQFDDSRLAINLMQSIIEQGGDAVNYMEVTGIAKDLSDFYTISVDDLETQDAYIFQAKAIVNATGVFVDDILRMADAGHAATVRVSQGIHLVLDRKFLGSDDALMIPETSDGRVLFAVPWHDRLVVGTTDTPVAGASLEPVALEEEIRFILDTAAVYLTRPPLRSDILSVFAGLRPLAAPTGGGKKTKEISRSHKIIVSPSGILTMLGGKWTTWRRMAEDMINRLEKEKGWKKTRSVSASLKIHGSDGEGEKMRLLEKIRKDGKPWINETFGLHEETIRLAVEVEMARTVEDILARRTRVLFLDAEEARRLAEPVAVVLADILKRDRQWIEAQVGAFSVLCDTYLP